METLGKAATLFGGNAFSSQTGQLIERATDSSLASEDWALILEICDTINETEDGPKDGIKAIRKRLSNQKNYKSILYTLTVTEACVKNCGPRLHKHVATKEFLADFTKLLGQRGQTSASPQVVQEKVLSLIQSWADAFKNAPELQAIKLCYDSLKEQGHEFPAQDLDKLSPIFTPNLVTEAREPITRANEQEPQDTGSLGRTFSPQNLYSVPPVPASSSPSRPSPNPTPVTQINPSVEQLGKLRSELDIVEGNTQVLSEMLTQLTPGQESAEDYELLMELNNTCREMQKRLQELVDRISNEEVTGVLLRINDNLNNVFLRYDRYDRSRKGINGELGNEMTEVAPKTEPSPVVVNNLIEFGQDMPSGNIQQLPQPQPQGDDDDEFEQFAQSRTITGRSPDALDRDMGSTYEDNIKGVPNEGSISDVISARGMYPGQPSGTTVKIDASMDDDIQDVEKWLKETDLSQLEAQQRQEHEEALRLQQQGAVESSAGNTQPMTSSEFDQFLSDRAMIGSQSVSQQPVSSSRQGPPASREMQMTNVVSGGGGTEDLLGL